MIYPLTCASQSEKPIQKTLIIDTLIGDAGSFWGLTDSRDTGTGGSGAIFILPLPKIEDPGLHPVLRVVLSVSSADAVLKLKLDDSNGYAVLKGLFNLKEEEIRIAAWRVFQAPYRDAIFKREIVYHVVPEDTADRYDPIKDQTTVYKVLKRRGPMHPSILVVHINGVRYEQPLQQTNERKQIISWHRLPDMPKEALLEHERSGQPYDVHTGSLIRNQPKLAATIELVE